ncbi:MAG: Lrp/AsnC family transcriptional regulator [Planctomycetota bacterium]|nr:Lrp/AsnC family transcriptional regulator [Planctomycetota bacterium]
MGFDQIDFEILRELQNNARISNKDLAEKNGIAPSTCLERVRRLKEEGVIQNFRAQVSAKALGVGVQAMIFIRLQQHAKISFENLCKEISQIEEVINVYLLAGNIDLLVHVAVRDVEHLRSVILDTFTVRYDPAHMETSIIFQIEHSHELPIYRAAN